MEQKIRNVFFKETFLEMSYSVVLIHVLDCGTDEEKEFPENNSN